MQAVPDKCRDKGYRNWMKDILANYYGCFNPVSWPAGFRRTSGYLLDGGAN